MKFYKYHGAGNDFLLADNRDGKIRLSADRSAMSATVISVSVRTG